MELDIFQWRRVNRDVNVIIISCIVSRVILSAVILKNTREKFNKLYQAFISLIRIFFFLIILLRDATRYFLYILITVDFDRNLCAADEIKMYTQRKERIDGYWQQNLRDL